MNFSDYIIFADESGDHGMDKIDPSFPVFALVFCVMRKATYKDAIEPAVRQLKFDFFGHDAPILHEREVRKQMPPFDMLRGDMAVRERFYGALNDVIANADMRVIASVIDKARHREKYADPWNPYEIAMHFCMERLCNLLVDDGQAGRMVHVLFESRGSAEDKSLELEFRKIVANQADWGYRRVDFQRCGFEPVFVPKAGNHAGHQLSDLIARPLALRALRPEQANRAGDIAAGKLAGWKVFP